MRSDTVMAACWLDGLRAIFVSRDRKAARPAGRETGVATVRGSIAGILLSFFAAPLLHAQPVVVYEAHFESVEGYVAEQELIGQQGWLGIGLDGNGVEVFDDYGQAALIGFWPPLDQEGQVSVWQPLDVDPVELGYPIVRFSTRMEIVDSQSVDAFDCFRWSAFNLLEEPLFKLDFDNFTREISYSSNGGESYRATGFEFNHGGFMDLEIWMNFERNLIQILLNDIVIVHAEPISTTASELTLGDIDAVWFIFEPEIPGDNYMIFDDYRVTLEEPYEIPPRLEMFFEAETLTPILRIYGEPGYEYELESSTDFRNWIWTDTLTAADDGLIEFPDESVELEAFRYYRVVVPAGE